MNEGVTIPIVIRIQKRFLAALSFFGLKRGISCNFSPVYMLKRGKQDAAVQSGFSELCHSNVVCVVC